MSRLKKGIDEQICPQSVCRKPFRIEDSGLILRAGVAKDCRDGLAWSTLKGQPHRAGDIDAGGQAEKKPFLAQELVQDGERVLIGNAPRTVHSNALDVFGHATLADAFSKGIPVVRLRVAVGEPRPHSRTIGVGAADENFRVALLEVQRGSAQRAAGADGGNKGTYLSSGLLPDLRACGAVVDEAVGGIVELVGPEPALFLCHPSGDMVVVARIGIGFLRHGEYLRAKRAQKVYFFLRLGFGNDDDGMVPPSVADDCEADAGVSSRALDDCAAWPQEPSGLRVQDDTKRGTVLHRSAGVHEFGLAEDFAAGQFRKAAQANERSVTDVTINPMVA